MNLSAEFRRIYREEVEYLVDNKLQDVAILHTLCPRIFEEIRRGFERRVRQYHNIQHTFENIPDIL